MYTRRSDEHTHVSVLQFTGAGSSGTSGASGALAWNGVKRKPELAASGADDYIAFGEEASDVR